MPWVGGWVLSLRVMTVKSQILLSNRRPYPIMVLSATPCHSSAHNLPSLSATPVVGGALIVRRFVMSSSAVLSVVTFRLWPNVRVRTSSLSTTRRYDPLSMTFSRYVNIELESNRYSHGLTNIAECSVGTLDALSVDTVARAYRLTALPGLTISGTCIVSSGGRRHRVGSH